MNEMDLAKIPYPNLSEEQWEQVVNTVFNSMQNDAAIVVTYYEDGYNMGVVGKCIDIDNANGAFVMKSGDRLQRISFSEVTHAYAPWRLV